LTGPDKGIQEEKYGRTFWLPPKKGASASRRLRAAKADDLDLKALIEFANDDVNFRPMTATVSGKKIKVYKKTHQDGNAFQEAKRFVRCFCLGGRGWDYFKWNAGAGYDLEVTSFGSTPASQVFKGYADKWVEFTLTKNEAEPVKTEARKRNVR
jgi:hypothetical protein